MNDTEIQNMYPIRACTCNKEFIKEAPKCYVQIKDGHKEYHEIPENLEGFEGLLPLQTDLYQILGCRGCKFTRDEIEQKFEKALQSSIIACVYGRTVEYSEQSEPNEQSESIKNKTSETSETKEEVKYTYISDALDPVFEQYCFKQGIVVGEPAVIEEGGSGIKSFDQMAN